VYGKLLYARTSHKRGLKVENNLVGIVACTFYFAVEEMISNRYTLERFIGGLRGKPFSFTDHTEWFEG